jgi:hypothetical protein
MQRATSHIGKVPFGHKLWTNVHALRSMSAHVLPSQSPALMFEYSGYCDSVHVPDGLRGSPGHGAAAQMLCRLRIVGGTE